MLEHGLEELHIDAKTGRFSYGPVLPGRYGVRVDQGRSPLGWSGIRSLVANTSTDLGDIVVGGPSSLRVIARDSNGKQLRDLLVQGWLPPRGQWGRLPGENDGQGFLAKRIPPLAFEIIVSSPSTVPVVRSLRFQPGRETKIEVTCKKATPCAFSFPKDAKSIQSARIFVRNAKGRTVVFGHLSRNPGYRRLLRGLAPGSYNMEIRSGKADKDRTQRRITVPEQDSVFEILLGK